MHGAVCVMCGAVGLADNFSAFCVAPFEGCHGRSSCSLFGGGVPVTVNLRITLMVLVKRRFRVACGRYIMQRTNLLATCCVCSVGESVGSWQWTGYNSNVPEMCMALVSGMKK
jgi:hypothetical protein